MGRWIYKRRGRATTIWGLGRSEPFVTLHIWGTAEMSTEISVTYLGGWGHKHWKSRRIYVALGHDELTYFSHHVNISKVRQGEYGFCHVLLVTFNSCPRMTFLDFVATFDMKAFDSLVWKYHIMIRWSQDCDIFVMVMSILVRRLRFIETDALLRNEHSLCYYLLWGKILSLPLSNIRHFHIIPILVVFCLFLHGIMMLDKKNCWFPQCKSMKPTEKYV